MEQQKELEPMLATNPLPPDFLLSEGNQPLHFKSLLSFLLLQVKTFLIVQARSTLENQEEQDSYWSEALIPYQPLVPNHK